jgi:hypothetical protein
MMKMHRTIVGLRARGRNELILALTPRSRAGFANIVARLVVDSEPDSSTAARAIDALLSADEKVAVVTAASEERAAERAAWESARAECGQPVTVNERMSAMSFEDRATDAGTELLRTVALSIGEGPREEPRR